MKLLQTMAVTFLILKVQSFHPMASHSMRTLRFIQQKSFGSKKSNKNLGTMSQTMAKLHRDEFDDGEVIFSAEDGNEMGSSDLTTFGSAIKEHKKASRTRPSRLLKEERMEHVPSGEPLPFASQYHTPVNK